MPEDPKNVFRNARKRQDAQAAAEKERQERMAAQKRSDRQRERRARQPEEGAPESEAAQWVRDNCEWEPYPALWVPKFCSWSDYSGSYADRANGKALLRDHADLFEEGHGGHGTVWVGIPEDKRLVMTDEQWESIKDIIDGLEDYPIIDDDLHSEMEMEAKYEYWEEYGREGVREFLVKKFNTVGDVDASIAVVARRNEFWDEKLREHGWEEDLNEEEGGNFYFDEKRALRDFGRDEVVDEEMVEATKKQVFFKSWAGGQASFGNQLDTALRQAGVDVENGHHLWQLVKYAEHVLGTVGVWEVSTRFHSSKAEVDPEDHISLVSVEDVVNVLSAPDAHQKMLHKHWAEDPRQLKLPDFESKAQALAAALLDGEPSLHEAEDPKAVFRKVAAAAPSYVIAGSSRLGMNVYFTGRRPYWTYNLKEAKQFPRQAALARMDALRCSYPSITHRAIMRVGVVKPTPGSPTVASMEAEDPKVVLRRASDPKGIPKRYIGNMPKEIEIWGRRWFSKTYGNSYFTARIYLDGQLVHTMPEEYGYGDHYMQQSFEWLEDNGYIPKRVRGRSNVPEAPPWSWCQSHGIRLNYHVEDVKRRDMFREAQQLASNILELEPI